MVQVELEVGVEDHIVLFGHEVGHQFDIYRDTCSGLAAGDLDQGLRHHLQLYVQALGGEGLIVVCVLQFGGTPNHTRYCSQSLPHRPSVANPNSHTHPLEAS